MIDKSRLIAIKIRQKVLSILEGRHKILKFGEEDDLKGIREYTYGDPIKKISWIISAKYRKPFVVERDLLKSQNIIICLLLDQEFLFGKKLDKLAEVYSLIAFSGLYQKDKLFTYIFTDTLERRFNHRGVLTTVEDVLRYIYSMELKNKRLNPVEIEGAVLRHKPSLVILIGDFFYKLNLYKLATKHKVAILKIREKDEENPTPYTGYQLISFDEKERIPNLVKPMVVNYKKNLEDIDTHLKKFTTLKKIPVETIYTYEDPLIKLKKVFS
ncbi:MAG: DUF58 domain-containing protein [Aquificae bacterium]|nr:DUF58 domain-containing protein [Aquificota bacterium]